MHKAIQYSLRYTTLLFNKIQVIDTSIWSDSKPQIQQCYVPRYVCLFNYLIFPMTHSLFVRILDIRCGWTVWLAARFCDWSADFQSKPIDALPLIPAAILSLWHFLTPPLPHGSMDANMRELFLLLKALQCGGTVCVCVYALRTQQS